METREGLRSLAHIMLELATLFERHLTEEDRPSGRLPELVGDLRESVGILQAQLMGD